MSEIKKINFENQLKNFTIKNVPYTNVIGLARSIIALGTLLTLLFNPIDNLFIKNISGEYLINPLLKEDATTKINLFLIFDYQNVLIAKWLAIVILIIVISGYYQKITSILHWWISYSFFHASAIIDGGDQIASILTLFLIPICFFDNRKNHWESKKQSQKVSDLISIFFLYVSHLQMAIIYFHAAVGKFSHNEWSDGTAIYYWLNHSYFGLPQHFMFLNNFLENSYFVSFLTYGVLLLELALFLALFAGKKYKIILLYLAIFFHIFIIIFMGIFSFFFSVLGGLIIYLYPTNKDIKFLCAK